MHVKVKSIAVMSIFAALSVILMFMGEIISINTLFFITAAAFLVSVIQMEYGSGAGLLFFFVCLALSLLVLPNKMHCITYFMLGFNIWFWKFIDSILFRTEATRVKKVGGMAIRLTVFNLTYIPIVLFFPQLIFAGGITSRLIVFAVILGQAGYFLLCYALRRFEIEIWQRFAGRIIK